MICLIRSLFTLKISAEEPVGVCKFEETGMEYLDIRQYHLFILTINFINIQLLFIFYESRNLLKSELLVSIDQIQLQMIYLTDLDIKFLNRSLE